MLAFKINKKKSYNQMILKMTSEDKRIFQQGYNQHPAEIDS